MEHLGLITLIIVALKIHWVTSCMQTSSASSPTVSSTTTSVTTTTAPVTTTTAGTTTTSIVTTTTATTTTTLPCGACNPAQVTLTAGTPTPTSMLTTGADGCANLVVTCTMTGLQVLMQFNSGANGTAGPAQDTVSETLVCDANGQWTLTANGVTAVITEVDCISA